MDSARDTGLSGSALNLAVTRSGAGSENDPLGRSRRDSTRRTTVGRSSVLTRLVAIGAIAAALVTAGCSSQRTEGGGAGGGSGPIKIGLVTKTDTNPYFVTLRDAAKAEAQRQGADLIALAGKFD